MLLLKSLWKAKAPDNLKYFQYKLKMPLAISPDKFTFITTSKKTRYFPVNPLDFTTYSRYLSIMKVIEKTDEIILSREEYEALIERIEDLEHLIDSYKAETNGRFIPWNEAVKDL